ncbi:tyrosinase-like protein 1 [Saccostrea cucullata]|uniref:tyrosinase-like protein 1 n=1 Tax=Saccostrea cuccullata TaxID=36930 RepID=UPI002ED1591E
MNRGRAAMLCMVLALVALPTVPGLMTPIPTPKALQECFMYKSINVSMSDTPGQFIQNYCFTKLALNMDEPRFTHNITKDGVRYLESLFRQLDGEIHEIKKNHEKPRSKRQVIQTWRIRQEVRTLSRAQLLRLTSCFTRLKNDYSIDSSMSTYDLIGSLHTGRAAENMHGGPGFFPRHALMMLIMETACRTPLAYWDMTMDADMNDPTNSIIWSPLFFGSGNGAVRDGPFGQWRTIIGTPIIRNIGSAGESLARKQGIRAMLSRRRLAEISEPSRGLSVFSVEVHHNGVHNWVDGHMARLNTAWFDPLFYFIHSFFTLIWIAFKGLQRTRGVDPQRDYPMGHDVPNGHEFFQRADFRPFLRPISNLEALSDTYDRMVTYRPMPRCPNCDGSPYLICRNQVCVSRSIAPRTRSNFFWMSRKKRSVDQQQGTVYGPKLPPTASSPSEPTTRPQSLTDENVDNKTLNVLQSSETALSTLDQAYQNTFIIDGRVDMTNWAWLNIKVLFERPKGFNFHATFPGQNGTKDMYDIENFRQIADEIGIHNQVEYKKTCSSSGSGAAKVYVQSDGLNYAGRYKDYAIIDERQPIYSSVSYIAIKKPTEEKPTKVILTAFDTCGRSCHVACPVPGTNGKDYEPCSGTFEVTTEFPFMFSSTYASAVAAAFSVHIDKGPLFGVGNIPITFVCDHQNKWPWE